MRLMTSARKNRVFDPTTLSKALRTKSEPSCTNCRTEGAWAAVRPARSNGTSRSRVNREEMQVFRTNNSRIAERTKVRNESQGLQTSVTSLKRAVPFATHLLTGVAVVAVMNLLDFVPLMYGITYLCGTAVTSLYAIYLQAYHPAPRYLNGCMATVGLGKSPIDPASSAND